MSIWSFQSPNRYITNFVVTILGYMTSAVDSTNYYLGCTATTPVAENNSYFYIKIPRKGIIKDFRLSAYVQSTLGSSENINVYLYRHSDGSSTLLGTMKLDAKEQSLNVKNLNFSVNEDENVSIRLQIPIMITNPGQVYYTGYLYFENE